MHERFLAAAIQLNSGEDKAANLQRASQLIEEAARQGAGLIALPEMFNCLGRFDTVVNNAEPIPGPTIRAMQELASELNVAILAGSIAEQCSITGKAYNTSVFISERGEQLARYRKVHLFDVALSENVTITESMWIVPGDEVVILNSTFGRVGFSICYDVRFPELYRCMADQVAEIIFAPAAFTLVTGRDHWEVLLRARAIENQVFVIAPNQCGRHGSELHTYGNSMIVDPWGRVLARAADQEEIVYAEIDICALQQIRSQLPALDHRRPLS
jgi:predicted amidohydrolase